MTIRTFWTVFMKILGIWLLLDSLTVVPKFFTTAFETGLAGSGQGLSLIMALLILTVAIYIFVLRLFLFRSAWLIDKLHLDKGFDQENISLDVNQTTVLSVATIVIGGLLLADSLPELCRQVFAFLQQEHVFREDPGFGWIIFYCIKTLTGYLLMTRSKLVVSFIEKQRSQPTEHT